jgi:hypothetical protein
MFTLHHPRRVLCAQVFHKVNIDENPTLTRFGTGDFPGTGFAHQGDGVNVQKFRRLFDSQGFHGAPPANTWGRKSA